MGVNDTVNPRTRNSSYTVAQEDQTGVDEGEEPKTEASTPEPLGTSATYCERHSCRKSFWFFEALMARGTREGGKETALLETKLFRGEERPLFLGRRLRCGMVSYLTYSATAIQASLGMN